MIILMTTAYQIYVLKLTVQEFTLKDIFNKDTFHNEQYSNAIYFLEFLSSGTELNVVISKNYDKIISFADKADKCRILVTTDINSVDNAPKIYSRLVKNTILGYDWVAGAKQINYFSIIT